MIQTNQDLTDINALQNAPGFNEEVPSMKDDKNEDTEDEEDDEDLEEDDLDEEDADDDDTDYEILPSNDSGLTTNNNAEGNVQEEGE